MLKPEDRQLVFALLAVAFALFVNVATLPLTASDFNQQQRGDNPGDTSQDRILPYETETFWVFMGFAATCVIAVYGIRQFEEGRRSSERQLRAYVQVSSCAIADAGSFNPFLGGMLTGSLLIANTGQTPAYKVVHWSRVDVLPFSQESTLIPPKFLPDISSSILGASIPNTKFVSLNRQISPSELAGILAGTHAMFVYGCIHYRDVFKVKRVTEYRLSFTGSYPPAPNISMSFCNGGNDAD